MRKVVLASMIGNGLEWYDYALYGHFAAVISLLFFPSDNNTFVSLVATFGIFAAGFLMRPMGAVLFGYIGDTYGRKAALSASILLMSIPTACIGFLPTYAQIGIWAPILLTVIRLVQGLALGGEMSGSIIYVTEYASKSRMAIASSTSGISMILGILLGSLVAFLCSSYMSPEYFISIGWRIPFIAGIFIGLIGFYIRSFLHESPVYLKAKAHNHISKTPIRDVFSMYRKNLFLAMGLYTALTIPFYLLSVFMNSYLSKILGYSMKQAQFANLVTMFLLLIFIPIGALIGDKYGKKRIIFPSLIAYILCAYPIFLLMEQGDFHLALLGQSIFALVVAFYISNIPAALVEVFPTNVRYTGIALSCNICAALLGGIAPMIATWLVEMTGSGLILSLYLAASAFVSLIALFYYKEDRDLKEA